jgi:ArsR family transcriptional regulator
MFGSKMNTALSHLPGALNTPLRQLEAVSALRAYGFKVRRFEAGFPEWKAAGLPVEVTA